MNCNTDCTNFRNKVAVVTGATRGIGRAITNDLLRRGCSVVGVYKERDDKAEELRKEFSNVTMIKSDVADVNIGEKIINKTIKMYKQIDYLINNAGIFLGGNIVDFSKQDWNRIIGVNVTSKYLLSKSAIPYLAQSENGVIINISSRFGLNEYTQPWCIAYGVTNSAVNNFTVGLAKELKDKGIRVNAVIPTVTDTDRFRGAFSKKEQDEIIQRGKLGTPNDVSRMVMDLIEDKSKTGEIIVDKRVYIQSDA